MAASKTAAAKATAKDTAQREHVKLPDAIPSEAAEWPGSKRSGGTRNAALRAQLETDIASMELDSVRRYDITGAKEQRSLATLFRKVCDEYWTEDDGKTPAYGVQTVTPNGVDGPIFVKLVKRIVRKTAK